MTDERATEPVFVTRRVARERLGVGVYVFGQMVKDGTVKMHKLGHRSYVVVSSLRDLVQSAQRAA